MVRRNSRTTAVDELRAARGIIIWTLASMLFWAVCISTAYATGYDDDDCRGHSCNEMNQEQDQHQGQEQDQDQHQGQEQGQHQSNANDVSIENAAAGGSAVNEGNEQNIEISSNYEGGPADLVLVPNNNTERCLRVFGFSFGNKDGSGMLGVPWRSDACDYEAAADDAFAAGERELGWFWKCQNKSLARRFKDKGEDWDTARSQCHSQMVGEVTSLRTIETLREQLTASEDLRRIERERHEELTTELNQLCEESKDRIAAACVSGK